MPSSNVKPIVALSLTGIASALVVAFHVPDAPAIAQPTATDATAATQQASGPQSTGQQSTSGATATATATPTTTATGESAGQYTDGTYSGTAVREPWGTFQVQAVISNGELVDVTIVSEPSDGHSSRINTQAVPILTEEALATQSASVDLVSGATWTSKSYASSLQAALDAAAA